MVGGGCLRSNRLRLVKAAQAVHTVIYHATTCTQIELYVLERGVGVLRMRCEEK